MAFFIRGFLTKILRAFPTRATYTAHLILYDLMIFDEEYRSLSSSLCSLLHSPVTASFLGSNIFLSTLFSNTLSRFSSLKMTGQVSHPYVLSVNYIRHYCVLIQPFCQIWYISMTVMTTFRKWSQQTCCCRMRLL